MAIPRAGIKPKKGLRKAMDNGDPGHRQNISTRIWALRIRSNIVSG